MRRYVKTLVETVADRAGYRVIPKWRMTTHQFAEHLATLFSLFHIDTVFDVGANKGQYHDFLRSEVGFKNRIWSFEPIPELARELNQRAKADPAWRVFNTALGSTAGTLALNVTKSSDFSSFLAPTLKHSAEFESRNVIIRQEDVPVRTLDSVFAEHAADLADANVYLKVDTQGFDLEVLKGGQTSLPSIAALQVELSITPIYDGMPGYLEVLRYLDSNDFSPSAFVPVGNAHPYKIVELDCCMVNNRMSPDITT